MARPPKIRKSGRLTAAEKKRRAGKQIQHAKAKPHQKRRRREPDPFDAVLDAHSEARYEDDPSAEPEQTPFDPGTVFVCIVDESEGFRG